ncbi:hypothetical protein KLP28_01745 [Nocardioidaceae bacterium]|nr:hypothetical protein KLP28_01745 [Nocardioidaceae bacterium]
MPESHVYDGERWRIDLRGGTDPTEHREPSLREIAASIPRDGIGTLPARQAEDYETRPPPR